MIYEGKNKVLYLMLNQALYGTLMAALFWYELLTETLLKNGFKLNPYDFYIAITSLIKKMASTVTNLLVTIVSIFLFVVIAMLRTNTWFWLDLLITYTIHSMYLCGSSP